MILVKGDEAASGGHPVDAELAEGAQVR